MTKNPYLILSAAEKRVFIFALTFDFENSEYIMNGHRIKIDSCSSHPELLNEAIDRFVDKKILIRDEDDVVKPGNLIKFLRNGKLGAFLKSSEDNAKFFVDTFFSTQAHTERDNMILGKKIIKSQGISNIQEIIAALHAFLEELKKFSQEDSEKVNKFVGDYIEKLDK